MFLSDPRDVDVTFGTPGDNAPFSFTLHDIVDQAAKGGDIGAIDWPQVFETTETFRRGVVAAERQTRLVDTINAHDSALREAAENRIVTVHQQTGIQLENPFDGGYELEARDRLGIPLTGASPDDLARLPMAQRDIFNERVDEAAQAHPDKAAALTFYQSLEDQAQAIGQSAAQGAGDVSLPAALVGGLWGSRRDPLFLGSLFAGPELSTARTVLGRIGWGAIKQGLFNAGLQAASQPAVQDWRRTIGERNGAVPALENVGMAFLFGAIPGAAIEGFRALNAGQKAAIGRVLDGTATPEDIRSASDAVNVQVGENVEREIRAGAADTTNDAVAAAARPPEIPAEQHADILSQAVRHADDPENNPPPELPTPVRETAAAIDENRTDRQVVDDKPVTYRQFKAGDLTTDAAAFQYKGATDAQGVNERLRNVSQFDPLASGKVLVYQRPDGTQVIADGHQRLGLANRLGDAGTRLDGFLFRADDGWTENDVRALAAKKNMQEGSGDAIDAARILRSRPDLLDKSLPITTPAMKNAVALSKLSDEAFSMALAGTVPPNHAAAVGAMVADPLQHASVLGELARLAPNTDREARIAIGEIQAERARISETADSVIATPATAELMGERVQVLDAAVVALAKDKKLFGTLVANADAIEAVGNRLARGANDARARDARALQDMLTRLARQNSEVSDALNRAAAQIAEGAKAKAAAEGFLDQVRTLLDRDGLPALQATAELKPGTMVEPASAEALAMAEAAHAARFEGAPEGGQPKSGKKRLRESAGAKKAKAAPQQPSPPETAPATPQGRTEAIGAEQLQDAERVAAQPEAQAQLFDSVAVSERDDGRDVRFASREAVMDDAARLSDYADLVAACKV